MEVNMKKIVRIGIFAIVCILMLSLISVSVFAQASPDVNTQTTGENTVSDTPDRLGEINGDIPFSERVEYAIQGTVTGMVMVFAVLSLLCIIVSLSKVIIYDIPRKAAEKQKAEQEKQVQVAVQSQQAPVEPEPVQTDDGELIAVITAAIAATIESGEYGDEFKSGFRVVSFKRAGKSRSWNSNK